MITGALTQRHRSQQLLVRRATQAQVSRIWPALDYQRLDSTFPGFLAAVTALIIHNRLTSTGLTMSYLREFRREAGIPGSTPPVKAETVNAEQFAIALRATSLAAVKSSTASGVPEAVAMNNARTQTRGSVVRLVLNGGRETLIANLAADPAASGYQRILGASGCEFCRTLVSRGGVYSEDTAGFQAHDHCACTAEPIYG